MIVEASSKLPKVPRKWDMISGADWSRPNFSPRREDPAAPLGETLTEDDSKQPTATNAGARGSADAPVDVSASRKKYVLRSGESYAKTLHASQVINHNEVYAALELENNNTGETKDRRKIHMRLAKGAISTYLASTHLDCLPDSLRP